MIDGKVSLQNGPEGRGGRIEAKFEVFQTSNNRPIADVNRVIITEPGAFEAAIEKKWNEIIDGLMQDLSSQVVEAWQKGSIGSSQLRLVLEPRPGLQDIESLKERLSPRAPAFVRCGNVWSVRTAWSWKSTPPCRRPNWRSGCRVSISTASLSMRPSKMKNPFACAGEVPVEIRPFIRPEFYFCRVFDDQPAGHRAPPFGQR